jgi:glycosyltransferase involved in cell wall biosynthesis
VSPGAARPPRICFNALFLQNHLGGIGNYCYRLLKHLRVHRPDWKLSLLVHKGTAPNFRDLEGVEILEVDIKRRIGRLLYFHLVFPFKTFRFDLLHSVGNMGMAFCPIPQIISIMDTYEQVSPERFSRRKRKLMALLISHSGRLARRIIAISENTRKDVERFYPHLKGKVEVVYCGNKFPVAEAPSYQGRSGFVFVGTLEPGKNLDQVLKAFASCRSRQGHRLAVIGAMGWKQSHIGDLVESLGVRDRVDFLGYVGDSALQALYARSVALVQASSYEGFGLPVIEAMASGCPVVCARNSALVEAGGDAALFFPTHDVPAMAALMDRLAEDPALGRDCVEKGLVHARKFTWDATAEATARVYGEVLPGLSAPKAQVAPG